MTGKEKKGKKRDSSPSGFRMTGKYKFLVKPYAPCSLLLAE
jgi:hypothetical protein